MNVISLNLEQKCDIDCIYCKRNDFLKKNNFKPKTYDEVLNEFKTKLIQNPDAKRVFLYGGGEPTELQNFKQLLQEISKYGLKISLETNGLKFSDKKFLQECIDCNVDHIRFSLNSYREKEFNLITQSNKYLDMLLALRNINEFAQHLQVAFSIVIMRQNLDHFYKIPFFIQMNFPNLRDPSYTFYLVRINEPENEFKSVAFRLSKYNDYITKKINFLRKKGFRIEPLGIGAGSFPICFFEELNDINPYFSQTILEDDRMHTKLDFCKRCKYYEKCPGIATTYIKVYGTKEIEDQFRKINNLPSEKNT